MDLHLDVRADHDLGTQIYAQLRAAMLEGRLAAGARVPSSRELAQHLSVSRTTTVNAYDRLVGEGFLEAVHGSGTFVATHLPSPSARVGTGSTSGLRAWADIGLPNAFDPPDVAFDLRSGQPDRRRFPHETWRRLLAAQQRPNGAAAAPYGHPAGHRGLRAALAEHLAITRAVFTSPEDVVVTQGFQQAVDVIARAVLSPGSTVAVETPGYLPPQVLLTSLGHRVVGVPVDDEGIVVDELPPDTALIIVTPTHQFPLGMTMSMRRRTALLDWARRHDAVIIEDDYDSEFRFGGRPVEALHGLDTDGRVVYAGSFSKSMLPSLRLGFVVVPPALTHAVSAAKFVTDWCSPLVPQAALAEFIQRGWYARHVRRVRGVYRARRDLMLQILHGEFADELTVLPSQAGLHVAVGARRRTATECREIRHAAQTGGVHLFTLRSHAPDSDEAGFVLGFGGIDAADLPEALARLRSCMRNDGTGVNKR